MGGAGQAPRRTPRARRAPPNGPAGFPPSRRTPPRTAMIRRLTLLLALPLLLLGCREDAGPDPLRVICEATFPPYEYRAQDAIDGIDPALCSIFAACLDRPLDIQDMAFDAIIAAVSVGKADIAASGITVTQERARQVAFSDPYVTSAQVAVVPTRSPILAPADLHGRAIAVQSGSTGDLHVTRVITKTPERYKTVIDAINAVRNGKADAAVVDLQPAQVFLSKNDAPLRLLTTPVTVENYAFAFPKRDPRLRAQVNLILAKMRETGALDRLVNLYLAANETGRTDPLFHAPAIAAIRDALANVPALRDALQALERDPSLNPPTATLATLWQDFTHALHANFVAENRWRYLLDGLGATLLITALATLIGIAIGLLVAIVRATHDMTGRLALLNLLCRIYLTVIRGTPVVVQLLIIYFVIFGSQDVSKILVAVVAFGLNSGAYVAEIIRAGIASVDKGQNEAGRSLGLTHTATMACVILPQALRNTLPALGNEFIVLLKETSVAGYIALTDLTKAGDIIRSQTYTALLPLLAVAAIYLAIVSLFAALLSRLEKRLKNHA